MHCGQVVSLRGVYLLFHRGLSLNLKYTHFTLAIDGETITKKNRKANDNH